MAAELSEHRARRLGWRQARSCDAQSCAASLVIALTPAIARPLQRRARLPASSCSCPTESLLHSTGGAHVSVKRALRSEATAARTRCTVGFGADKDLKRAEKGALELSITRASTPQHRAGVNREAGERAALASPFARTARRPGYLSQQHHRESTQDNAAWLTRRRRAAHPAAPPAPFRTGFVFTTHPAAKKKSS